MHALNETSLRIYPVGTVLIAMYGGFKQIGRTGLLRIPAAVNQAITAIQPATNILWPEYLLMALNYRVDHWKGVASSSRKDPNITSHDIRSFCIALPSVSEQLRDLRGAGRSGCPTGLADPAHRQEAIPQTGRHASASHKQATSSRILWRVACLDLWRSLSGCGWRRRRSGKIKTESRRGFSLPDLLKCH